MLRRNSEANASWRADTYDTTYGESTRAGKRTHMFLSWGPRLGSAIRSTSMLEAVSWGCILFVWTVHPAAGWCSVCAQVGVSPQVYYLGMVAVLVWTGSTAVALVFVCAAGAEFALERYPIHTQKASEVQPLPDVLSFV